MFGIINAVAYQGLMVNGANREQEATFPRTGEILPESKWLDVSGNDAEGHWIPAEGERLRQILDYLLARGYDMAEFMVVGPFRDVAKRLGVPSRGLCLATFA